MSETEGRAGAAIRVSSDVRHSLDVGHSALDIHDCIYSRDYVNDIALLAFHASLLCVYTL